MKFFVQREPLIKIAVLASLGSRLVTEPNDGSRKTFHADSNAHSRCSKLNASRALKMLSGLHTKVERLHTEVEWRHRRLSGDTLRLSGDTLRFSGCIDTYVPQLWRPKRARPECGKTILRLA